VLDQVQAVCPTMAQKAHVVDQVQGVKWDHVQKLAGPGPRGVGSRGVGSRGVGSRGVRPWDMTMLG